MTDLAKIPEGKIIYNDIDVSEKEKLSTWYLENMGHYLINTLSQQHNNLTTARDYYNLERDLKDFKYLEDRYGFGNENTLEFQPVIRKHIEVLKGQFLQNPFTFHITCKDNKTLHKIEEARKTSFVNDLFTEYEVQIQEHLKAIKDDKVPVNRLNDSLYKELTSYYEENWLSLYEISAQHVIDYLLQSKEFDFKQKAVQLFENFLVYGSAYYRIKTIKDEDPTIDIVNPLNIYYSKNNDDKYINNCTKVVYKFHKNSEEIVNEFGDQMTKDQIKSLFGNSSIDHLGTDFIDEKIKINKLTGYKSETVNNHECYHVQWLANNKVTYFDYKENKKITKYRLDLYEIYKINGDFIGGRKVWNSHRSVDKPYKTKIQYNGVSYTDYNGKPYSLILKTKHLQDKFDIAYYHLSNYISRGGNRGVIVDEALIPTNLGKTPGERRLRAINSIKQGYYPIDSGQDGVMDRPVMNTIFQPYDLSIQTHAVEAYKLYIHTIEETISSFTGVPRQMLGQIEERDPVKGMEISMRQGLVINKHYFTLIEILMKSIIEDSLDHFKSNMKNSRTKRNILGTKNKIFGLQSDHISFTDHDVHVSDSVGEIQEMEKIQSVAMELINRQDVSLDMVLEVLTSSSITDAKLKTQQIIRDKDQKQDQIAQATQMLEQLSTEMKEVQKELDAKDKELKKSLDSKFELEERKLEQDRVLKEKDLEFKEKQLAQKMKADEMHLKAELAQTVDDNPHNNEIRNL